MNALTGGFGGTWEFSHGGHSWMTMGEWRSKALSVVKPHEELEPLEADHPYRRLCENPNPYDTQFDYNYERWMFLDLCGVGYEWIVSNKFGKPCEKWVIPSHWVWPRTGGRVPDGGWTRRSRDGRLQEPEYDRGGYVGDYARYGNQYVNPAHPDADRLIQYYEVRPWGGMGSAGILRLPPDEIVMTVRKSPVNKIDGYSKLSMIAAWIDEEESISKSRWSQAMNTARPELWVELGPGYDDPDDDRIARYEAKFMSKFQGEYNYGKPIFTPAGAKLTPLSFSPSEMAYYDSENQIRDMILSAFSVPKTVVGISEEMTYGSLLASLASFCAHGLNPDLAMIGQRDTKSLASRWDDDEAPAWSSASHGGRSVRRRVRSWYDDCVPADPTQVNSDISTDISCYAITPNEVRAMRGRKPYKYGGSDPMVQGPGGPMPLPLNTGEDADLEQLAQLIKPMTQGGQEQGGQQPQPELAAPQLGVQEPNGEPEKRWDAWFSAVGRTKEWNAVKSVEHDSKRREVWATVLEMNRLNDVQPEGAGLQAMAKAFLEARR